MTHDANNPLAHPEVQLANGRGYILAYVLSSLLMVVATWVVAKHAMAPLSLMLLTTGLAGVAVVVQGVFLLHMELSETQLWHTVSLVLFIPLFILAVGLTAWMFHGLYRRTMLMPPMNSSVAVSQSATTKRPVMPGMMQQ